ncbi:hypothetical protein [Streptomyces alfalfae]|uniref:hypothetical protein n=1 Tax=Streptomyces alfalfae TaxID=1642299 RepID=UPI0028124352|nr:hypothetical protein [Streptomyces alfalfae]
MRNTTLPRRGPAAGAGWAHPYGHAPFSPFLYADGGDADGSGSGDSDAGDGDTGGSGDGDGGDGSDNGAGSGQGTGKSGDSRDSGESSEARVARLEKELKAANAEAGKARTTAKKQAAEDARKQLAEEIGKALGLVKEDAAETDPAKLLEQLKAEQTKAGSAEEAAIAARVEATVVRTAFGLGIDGDKLLDSRSFCEQVDDLDPSDPAKFRESLKKLITKAAEKNPAVRLQSSAGRSGPDLSGGTGEGAAKRGSGGLAGAIRGHYQT